MAAAPAAPPPRPKSPPATPDPCGRHRLQLAVDALHREIGFLEVDYIPGILLPPAILAPAHTLALHIHDHSYDIDLRLCIAPAPCT